MRILLTGGGSGGHFYPLIAVAERIKNLAAERRILRVDIYFMSDSPYDTEALKQNEITFIHATTGKKRVYKSLLNFTDNFKIFLGVIEAIIKLFILYPDVVIAKGGYGSFPALFAARILRIPVIIHESDTYPGRVNLWASKFAESIGVAYKQALPFFPEGKTALIGLPIRSEIMRLPTAREGAEYYKLDPHIPTIFIYAGSLGAEKINNLVLEALPDMLKNYQVIHQCGKNNENEIKTRISVILEKHPFKSRYVLKPYLNAIDTRNAAAVSSLVISRAGSTLFEIAAWNIPAIVIPITNSHGNHQVQNALRYAEIGAGTVIEESNAHPHILLTEIETILMFPEKWKAMHEASKSITTMDAADEIARRAILIGESHEFE